jgi:hypothetical protein
MSIVEHNAKYDEIIEKAGGVTSLRFSIPAPIEVIREALANGDEHLNTIPLQRWDHAAQFAWLPRGLSLAEKVCTLKRVAKVLAEKQES